ncbi:MAG: thioredoxin [Acholeplasmataceae bacterium]|jgi:thioredoxin 1|nr:thioredoxin [Acholeplasmataceae bacterium]
MALTITKENFKKLVLESDKPVLIDFYASWCIPCQMFSPIIDSLAAETNGLAVVGKVNIEQQAELANQFKIMSVPTVVIFEKGKIVNHFTGLKTKNELKKLLNL